MSEPRRALEKLQEIQELWVQLRCEKWDSPASRTLLEKISALSAEYQSLASRTESEPRS